MLLLYLSADEEERESFWTAIGDWICYAEGPTNLSMAFIISFALGAISVVCHLLMVFARGMCRLPLWKMLCIPSALSDPAASHTSSSSHHSSGCESLAKWSPVIHISESQDVWAVDVTVTADLFSTWCSWSDPVLSSIWHLGWCHICSIVTSHGHQARQYKWMWLFDLPPHSLCQWLLQCAGLPKFKSSSPSLLLRSFKPGTHDTTYRIRPSLMRQIWWCLGVCTTLRHVV